MTKISLLKLMVVLCLTGFLLVGCSYDAETQQEGSDQEVQEETQAEEIGDIVLEDLYGDGSTYQFTYEGEGFTAIYYYDNWCVYDSYKITKKRDMKKICQALIDEHPVHGSDYESFRTADDMVYEWKQHNIAYALLPDDNPWKVTSGNVDFDPEDQGKSLEEIYESRTGEEFNYMDHTDDIDEYIKRLLQ